MGDRQPASRRHPLLPALVADCGVEADKLPPIVACTEVIGTLTPTAAAHLGLPTTVRVVAGAIDNTAAAIGAGTTGDNEPHLYVGTSSWIAAHVPRKKTDVAAGIASVPCAIGDRYLMTALQATAGANLTWLRDKIVEYDDPLLSAGQLSRDEGTIFDAFDMIIPTVPPGANGVLYTPGSTANAPRWTTPTCAPGSSTSPSTPTARICCGRSSRASRSTPGGCSAR
ncbi:hypothetical protein GCM10029963_06000 [Micromonospora andamanensis]